MSGENLIVGTQLQYVEVKISSTLRGACADAIALANTVRMPVIFEFNNTIAVVHPESDLEMTANLIYTSINNGKYTRKYINCGTPVKKE
jgi:hypothetical protein